MQNNLYKIYIMAFLTSYKLFWLQANNQTLISIYMNKRKYADIYCRIQSTKKERVSISINKRNKIINI